MKIYVNGDALEINEEFNVQDLLQHFDLHTGTIIVERNHCIVPDNTYKSTKLKENDEIELLSIFGGG